MPPAGARGRARGDARAWGDPARGHSTRTRAAHPRMQNAAARVRGAEQPEIDERERALRRARIRLARLAQVREQRERDGAPRHTRRYFELTNGQGGAPEPLPVLDVTG